MLSSIFITGATVALIIYSIGVWAAWRFTHRRQLTACSSNPLPSITLIKPIKGLEDELETNLISFFEQDYPAPIQIVFSSTEKNDPGMIIAREVAFRYPDADVNYVLSDPGFGLNPKVANMQGALSSAQHDIILQSDANVRIPPRFLRKVVNDYLVQKASLLGCLVVGSGERTIGAGLENLQLTGFIGPSMCAVNLIADTTCILGKAMMFRKSELRKLGGLSRVKDVLLEDFVLGEIYQQAGKKLVLSNTLVENINVNTSIFDFISRHSRWYKMTRMVSKTGFVADIFSNPLVFALAALSASKFDIKYLLLTCALTIFKMYSDNYLVLRMRGTPIHPSYLWLSPIKDILLGFVWIYTLFSRTTTWRGIQFRLSRGTQICSTPADYPKEIGVTDQQSVTQDGKSTDQIETSLTRIGHQNTR